MFIGAENLIADAEVMDRAWSERPRLALDMNREALLGSALRRTADHFGLDEDPRYSYFVSVPSNIFYGFWFEGDDGLPTPLKILLDPQGAALWSFDPQETTLGDALDSREKGLLAADPTRLFLLLDAPTGIGGNGLNYWFEVLMTLQQVAPHVKDAVEVAGTSYTLYSVMKASARAVKRRWSQWSTNGADIRSLQSLFQIARTTEEAAQLLGLSTQETPSMLQFLGLSLDSQGHWRPVMSPKNDELAEMAQVIDEIAHRSLPGRVRDAVLVDILAARPGSRLDSVDGLVRSHELRFQNDARGAEYILSRIKNADDYLVRAYQNQREYIVGRVVAMGEENYAAILPSGEPINDASGTAAVFDCVDAGALALIEAAFRP